MFDTLSGLMRVWCCVCRYNTTQYFWSSTRYTRSDCQWLGSALPGEDEFVRPSPSQAVGELNAILPSKIVLFAKCNFGSQKGCMLCLAANKQARSTSLLKRYRQLGIHANILAGAPVMLSNRLSVGCAGALLLEPAGVRR